MSEFICKKPIKLSGRDFSYGEVIPDGFVLPERALTLIRSNHITEIEGGLIQESVTSIEPIQPQIEEFQLTIPIITEKGNLELIMSSETVVSVLTIMQKTVEEATKDISVLEDESALILINAVDSRKGVQKAAEDRNIQLRESRTDNSSGGESTGDV